MKTLSGVVLVGAGVVVGVFGASTGFFGLAIAVFLVYCGALRLMRTDAAEDPPWGA